MGLVKKFKREMVNDEWFSKAGQLLCGKNETRYDLNRRMRKILGRESTFPVHGDRLVMLSNDHKLGILNGTLATCMGPAEQDESDPTYVWMNILYEKTRIDSQRYDAGPFLGKTEPRDGPRRLMAGYGYALTVHKAQGSQWPSVVLYDDGFGKREPLTRNRWLYTAITRAEKHLYIVTS